MSSKTTIKGWGILLDGEPAHYMEEYEYTFHRTKKSAENHLFGKLGYRVVPIIITYQLPKRKKIKK